MSNLTGPITNILKSHNLKRKGFDSIRRFREKTKPFIESHRGCNKEEDENTLAAFIKAIEYGCDSIEFDVWLTKDKIPVVIHGNKDGNIKETTNGEGKVNTFTLEELSKYSTVFNNHRIPTLEDVLELCKNKMFMNIEVKEKDFTMECIEMIIDRVIHHKINDQVAISTFEQNYWNNLKKISDCNYIELGYLYDNHENKAVEFYFDESKHNATMNVWQGEVTAQFVEKAHENNIAVHCWFCLDDKEDEDIIKHLIKCEVDVICCNYPRNALKIRDNLFSSEM